jgi:hypothetical protein
MEENNPVVEEELPSRIIFSDVDNAMSQLRHWAFGEEDAIDRAEQRKRKAIDRMLEKFGGRIASTKPIRNETHRKSLKNQKVKELDRRANKRRAERISRRRNRQ